MNKKRFREVTRQFPRLRIAIVGDFCLDRYLEIDPARRETSIETNLPVHNVVRVRSQPGAAGTILNNLVALGIGEIYPVGFCGNDGEGFELRRALQAKTGVRMDHFLETPKRRTFTYCKPLVIEPGKPPVELNRLDSKNWTETPPAVRKHLALSLATLAKEVDGVILMDQVDLPETGVLTRQVRDAARAVAKSRPELLIIADSRRGLKGYPPVTFKMNGAELAALTGSSPSADLASIRQTAQALARDRGRSVFVTLAERGIVGAAPDGTVEHTPVLPLRGEIDIVGAGDAVTANLASSLAAGASLGEAITIANAAASIVIHQLGTTGTATVRDIGALVARFALPDT